jgi:hypothetical protein
MRGVVVDGEAGLLAGDMVLGSWTARVVFLVMDRREMLVPCGFSLAANASPQCILRQTTWPPNWQKHAESRYSMPPS